MEPHTSENFKLLNMASHPLDNFARSQLVWLAILIRCLLPNHFQPKATSSIELCWSELLGIQCDSRGFVIVFNDVGSNCSLSNITSRVRSLSRDEVSPMTSGVERVDTGTSLDPVLGQGRFRSTSRNIRSGRWNDTLRAMIESFSQQDGIPHTDVSCALDREEFIDVPGRDEVLGLISRIGPKGQGRRRNTELALGVHTHNSYSIHRIRSQGSGHPVVLLADKDAIEVILGA